MAQKRMFDKTITNDDNFLEMPIGSQVLYFHLSMNADDDGFINNWKSIMRMIGAKEDDLKVLVAKSYVIPFETGVIVIKHWKINNYLRNDRYKPTRFQEEYKQLTLNDDLVYQLDTNGVHSIDKNRIEKNSIEEYSINNNRHFENDYDSEFEQIWLHYPRKQGKKDALKHYIKARKKGTTKEQVLEGLENYNQYIQIEKIEPRYIKQGSTWFNQECWKDDYSIKRKMTTKDIEIDISDIL